MFSGQSRSVPLAVPTGSGSPANAAAPQRTLRGRTEYRRGSTRPPKALDRSEGLSRLHGDLGLCPGGRKV
jgi:hypothetical protein